ncbi:hypothetical protein OG440_04135 [Streptomyces sp. NBC_00637]|uniref:hypothetical protein n=1 Tax=Streptomyces sp. NBC_00637 TaxID=2903667 RepID=UPI0032463E78
MTAELGETRRGWPLPRFTLALCAVAVAHFATAVAFGHSVGEALGALAEDTVMLLVVLSVVAYVRARTRPKAPSG